MPLSEKDREAVKALAKRQANLINAMTEARFRLRGIPQSQRNQLHARIICHKPNDIPIPEVKDLDQATRNLEERVRELWQIDTPEG